ncbi:hypothetical protein HRG84_13630 [Flavisolibacter sp. BT320]|nr:hypothetical protein [Flavisolibacter longurius]
MPRQTKDTFELLSKGQFICSNSVDDNIRKLYNIIEENYEDLYTYFSAIGFALEKGDEFFYFSRHETKTELERKIEAAYRWIDLVDFCKTFDNAFGSGYRFTASQMEVQLRMDALLKDKLEGLKRHTGEGSFPERIKKLIEMLYSYGVVEMDNNIHQQYKVLSSFTYLEQLILQIHIPEETQHEIPQ